MMRLLKLPHVFTGYLKIIDCFTFQLWIAVTFNFQKY